MCAAEQNSCHNCDMKWKVKPTQRWNDEMKTYVKVKSFAGTLAETTFGDTIILTTQLRIMANSETQLIQKWTQSIWISSLFHHIYFGRIPSWISVHYNDSQFIV
jgi:hypothetical protein